MNREEFLKEFKKAIQTEEDVTFESSLLNLEEWDSLGMMATIALLDNSFNLKYTIADMQNMDTVEDLLKNTGL